jgi:intracellular multiplication protein IcmG
MNQDTQKEDEYQFPNDDEYASASASAQKDSSQSSVDDSDTGNHDENVFSDASATVNPKQGVLGKYKHLALKFPILNNRKFIFTVLALFFAVIIFSFTKPSESDMHAVKPVKLKPAVVAAKVMPTISVNNTQVNALKQRVKAGNQEAANLSEHVRELQVSINQLTSQQNQLAQIISTQQKQIKELSKKITDSKKPKFPVVDYKLKAIVPGRAWLIGSDGTTVTVAVGTTLPSYGKVISIDAKSGVIMTSSHKKIIYGQADF